MLYIVGSELIDWDGINSCIKCICVFAQNQTGFYTIHMKAIILPAFLHFCSLTGYWFLRRYLSRYLRSIYYSMSFWVLINMESFSISYNIIIGSIITSCTWNSYKYSVYLQNAWNWKWILNEYKVQMNVQLYN